MEYGINDSLKSRAYGQKKDILEKEDHISRVAQSERQYYPREANGNINEWGAIL